MRLIDADSLGRRRFEDVKAAELYKLGWNDAISSIMTFEPTKEDDRVKIDGITKGALMLPWIVAIQIDRSIKFLCACNCKESADRLARSVGGFVVSSKEVKQ